MIGAPRSGKLSTNGPHTYRTWSTRMLYMSANKAEFWNSPLASRWWRGLHGTLEDLVAAYGRREVAAALKRVPGTKPVTSDDRELRILIAGLDGSYLDGSGKYWSQY